MGRKTPWSFASQEGNSVLVSYTNSLPFNEMHISNPDASAFGTCLVQSDSYITINCLWLPPKYQIRERSSITSAGFPKFGPPPPVSARSAQVLTPLICWCNTWTKGKLIDDLYNMFLIIKICFSIIIRNIFWVVEAVFKDIRAWFRKKFISLLIISSILHQYLLHVSTLSRLPFKGSAVSVLS